MAYEWRWCMEQNKEHSKTAERAPLRLNITLHWRKPPHVPDARTARLEALITEIGRLSVDQRAAVARGLSMLWQGFIAKFDGLDGFFECGFEERAEYLRELEAAHETMSKSEALADSRYSLRVLSDWGRRGQAAPAFYRRGQAAPAFWPDGRSCGSLASLRGRRRAAA